MKTASNSLIEMLKYSLRENHLDTPVSGPAKLRWGIGSDLSPSPKFLSSKILCVVLDLKSKIKFYVMYFLLRYIRSFFSVSKTKNPFENIVSHLTPNILIDFDWKKESGVTYFKDIYKGKN